MVSESMMDTDSPRASFSETMALSKSRSEAWRSMRRTKRVALSLVFGNPNWYSISASRVPSGRSASWPSASISSGERGRVKSSGRQPSSSSEPAMTSSSGRAPS